MDFFLLLTKLFENQSDSNIFWNIQKQSVELCNLQEIGFGNLGNRTSNLKIISGVCKLQMKLFFWCVRTRIYVSLSPGNLDPPPSQNCCHLPVVQNSNFLYNVSNERYPSYFVCTTQNKDDMNNVKLQFQ